MSSTDALEVKEQVIKEEASFKQKEEKQEEKKESQEKEGKTEKAEEKQEKDKKVLHSVDTSLSQQKEDYKALEQEYSVLKQSYDELNEKYSQNSTQLKELMDFKAQVELKQKQEMIQEFSMLTQEDKQDVLDNINSYSLSEIEAKLAIIFTKKEKQKATTQQEAAITYSLSNAIGSEEIPKWIQAIDEQSK